MTALTDEQFWQQTISEALLNRAEYNFLDFKRNASEKTERLKEHINAFGNLQTGGCFVFGVDDDFSIIGIDAEWDELIKRITHIAQNTQEPPLTVNAFGLSVDSKNLLCMHVLPSLTKPVFIQGRAPLGGAACFKRTGSSTVAMSTSEIRLILANAADSYFDESVVTEEDIEQLDFAKLKKLLPQLDDDCLLAPKNISVLMDYQILRGLKKYPKITVAGWLCFAKLPQSLRQFRNACIEFQLYRGITRDNPLKKYEITGTLPEQIEQCIVLLQQNIWVIPKLQGVRREDVPAYQETTLREVITNSVVHRDYHKMHQPIKVALFKDRIEIENPGGLMPGLTTMNMVHHRDWRNPLLAELMKKFGFGEMDGQGIDRLYAATLAFKVPPPIFIDQHGTFTVVLSAPKAYEAFSPQEKKLMVVILLIMEHEVDNESIRNCFGIAREKASTLIKLLLAENVLTAKGASRKFAKYGLSENYQEKIYG